MRLKPKRRIILIGAALLVVAVGAFALLFVRNWQKQRITAEYFAKGQEAFKARNYPDALFQSGQYLARARNSPAARTSDQYADALFTYAESRRFIEEPDYHNLRDCIAFYVPYIERRPDDAAAKLTLLKVYNQMSRWVEAKDLAAKSRPRDLTKATVADIPVLKEEATARHASRTFDETTERVLDALLKLSPLDATANMVRFSVNAEINRRDATTARINQLLADYPNNAEVFLIAGLARLMEPRVEEFKAGREYLCKAAGIDSAGTRINPGTLSSESSLLSLLSGFALLRDFDSELLVLEDSVDRVKNPVVERLLLRRWWQDSRSDAILERTVKLDVGSRDSDTEALAFRALSLQRSDKPDEAATIAAALKTRVGDYRAQAWSSAIPLMGVETRSRSPEAVTAWKDVVKSCPNEPIFYTFYGEALSGVGRNEEARQAWQDALKYPNSQSWYLPRVRIVETLLADSRPEEAAAAADDAVAVAPNRVLVNVVYFEAQAARVQTGSTSGQTPALLALRIDEIITKIDEAPKSKSMSSLRERLLVPRVLFLARASQTERAKAAAMQIINAEPPPETDTLQRLAGVSARENLGVEALCMKRVEALGGKSTSVIYVEAIALADAGKQKEGLELIRKAALASPDDTNAQAALARYIERTGTQADALAEWIRLGDRFPKDLDIQRACLETEVTSTDPKFVETTLKRYTELVGTEPGPTDAIPTMAKARAIMNASPGRADRDRAVAMLGALTASQPKLVEAKRLLASALAYAEPTRQITPDLPRAAAQLSEAAILEPANSRVALELAAVLQRQGQFDKSRDQLIRVASDPTRTDSARLRAAEMLVGQGERSDAATKAIEDLIRNAPVTPPPSLLVILAEGYISQGKESESSRVYDKLATGAATDADSIYMTAKYFSVRGMPDRAKPALDRLETLTLGAGEKDFILGRIAADRGDFKAMSDAYERAVTAAPNRPDYWGRYISGLLKQGKVEDALKIADRAVAAVPGDAGLKVLHSQAMMIKDSGADGGLAALKQALSADPRFSQTSEIVAAVEEAYQRKELSTVKGLVSLADRFPSYTPIQVFVARAISRVDPTRTSVLLSRAMAIDPTDAASARSAAQIYRESGRFSDMLAAALDWRQRDRTRSVEADIGVAEAYLFNKQPDKGLEILTPRVAAAAANPADPYSRHVLNVQARLLLAAGREPAARALLAPTLPLGFEWRCAVWLPIAIEATPSVEIAKSWFDQLRAAIPPDAADEIAACTIAPSTLAQRFPDKAKQLQAETLQNLLKLTQTPATATALVYESVGMLYHTSQDLPKAEAAYRKALELDSNRGSSLNNLANLLFEGAALEEALSLAQRAVAIAPESPDYVDTLAEAYSRLSAAAANKGDTQAVVANARLAAEAYKKLAELKVGDSNPYLAAANMYEKAGDTAAAIGCYNTLLEFPKIAPPIMAQIKNNLAMAIIRSSPKTADIDRAAALVNEAIQLFPHPAFFDTLGWVELKANRLASAADAFTQSIRLFAAQQKPDQYSPQIGLAIVQSQGQPSAREEARRTLEALSGKKLSPEDAARLEDLKKRLAKP